MRLYEFDTRDNFKIELLEKDNSQSQAIAALIRDKIGTKLLHKLDAWNLTAPASGLKFRIRKGGNVNYVEITYNENKLYDIELGSMGGAMDVLRDKHKTINTINNVNADNLDDALLSGVG